MNGGATVTVLATASGVRVGSRIDVILYGPDGARTTGGAACTGTSAACSVVVVVALPTGGGIGAVQAVLPAVAVP